MVSADELQDLLAVSSKTWFMDNFDTTEHLTGAVTGSGEIEYLKNCITLNTQVLANSTARLNYTTQSFNPTYSRMLMKVELSSMSDVFAFWGFSGDLEAPTWHQDKTHSGFMLYQGTLYAVTGDDEAPSSHYRVTAISGIDCTRELIYEISNYNFRWYSIPTVTSYFDTDIEPFLARSGFRKWSGVISNATVQPSNQNHYIYFFIKNLTNANKYMKVKTVCFREDYSD